MSESFITLTLLSYDSDKSIRLIKGFQNLRSSDSTDEQELREIMDEYFGQAFSDAIYADVCTIEDVLKYKKFIHARYLDDMDHFMFSLKNRTLNDQRIWQDTYSEAVSGYELSPSDIMLKTRSAITRSSVDKIVLDYECDDCYILKAAVFATAFESVEFVVDGVSTNNEYEA